MPDGERLRRLIPYERNLATIALLVAIAIKLVLIKGELSIGSGIDTDFQVVPFLFGAILHFRAYGQDAAGRNVQRHDVLWGGPIDGLAAMICLSCPEIIPCATVRQIDMASGSTIGHDWCHEEVAAKHVLVGYPHTLCVVLKGYGHGLHEGLVGGHHLMGCAVKIGQQAIAQANVAQDIVVVSLSVVLLSKLPNLAWCLVAMEAHHGAEARELCPTVVERAPTGIAYTTITADEECSCVTVPIGQTRNAEVAGCGNLCCQGLPTRGDVATPHKGPRALHTGKSGAGEDAHAFVRQAVFCAVVVVDTFHMTEREGIAQGAEGASAEARHIVVVCRLVAEVIGFGRVEPDGVDTLAHQSFIKVIPIAGSRVGVIDIIGACGHAGGITLDGDEAASLAKLLVLLGGRTEVWPYADH